jgi:hypothetical protein
MSSDTIKQALKRRRQHRQRSVFESWLHRIRTSRTAKKKFLNQLLLVLIVLAAFVFGLYALGPIISYSLRK